MTSVIFSACLSLNTGATPLPETFKTIIKLYKVWNIQFFVLFCFVFCSFNSVCELIFSLKLFKVISCLKWNYLTKFSVLYLSLLFILINYLSKNEKFPRYRKLLTKKHIPTDYGQNFPSYMPRKNILHLLLMQIYVNIILSTPLRAFQGQYTTLIIIIIMIIIIIIIITRISSLLCWKLTPFSVFPCLPLSSLN